MTWGAAPVEGLIQRHPRVPRRRTGNGGVPLGEQPRNQVVL